MHKIIPVPKQLLPRTTTEDIKTRSRYYNSQQDPILSTFGMIPSVTNVGGDS